MSNIIFIQDLSINLYIGVHAFEKAIAQKIILDLELDVDFSQAAKSDDLKDTLDYQALCQHIKKYLNLKNYNLIETVGHNLCDLILDNYAVTKVSLTLKKPKAIADAQCVGVKIVKYKN